MSHMPFMSPDHASPLFLASSLRSTHSTLISSRRVGPAKILRADDTARSQTVGGCLADIGKTMANVPGAGLVDHRRQQIGGHRRFACASRPATRSIV